MHNNFSNRCSDQDECASSPCHPNATCFNTDGEFECYCDASFLGDGFTCVLVCDNGFHLKNQADFNCGKFSLKWSEYNYVHVL